MSNAKNLHIQGNLSLLYFFGLEDLQKADLTISFSNY